MFPQFRSSAFPQLFPPQCSRLVVWLMTFPTLFASIFKITRFCANSCSIFMIRYSGGTSSLRDSLKDAFYNQTVKKRRMVFENQYVICSNSFSNSTFQARRVLFSIFVHRRNFCCMFWQLLFILDYNNEGNYMKGYTVEVFFFGWGALFFQQELVLSNCFLSTSRKDQVSH